LSSAGSSFRSFFDVEAKGRSFLRKKNNSGAMPALKRMLNIYHQNLFRKLAQ